jgi:RNA polymerase sigma factor (sigma-70 family)
MTNRQSETLFVKRDSSHLNRPQLEQSGSIAARPSALGTSIGQQPMRADSTVETTYAVAHPIALRSAQVRSNAAVKSGAVPAADRDDLIQEALVACWLALPRFDPTRAALPTFIERVVTTSVASFIRSARRVPAHKELKPSISPQIESGSGELELRADVKTFLASLRPKDRELAVTLMEHSPAEASRLLGIPLSTLHDRMTGFRRRLSAAGLKPIAVKRGRKPTSRPDCEVCNAA